MGIESNFQNDEQIAESEIKPEAKRPGGELKGKPAQGQDGKWYNVEGKEISPQEAIDQTYAAEFWRRTPTGVRDAFAESIQRAEQNGRISVFVNKDGIEERDKEKLSAIRQPAKELGYEMGQWERIKAGTGTASAPIKKNVAP